MADQPAAAPSTEQVVERLLNLCKPGEDAHRQRVARYDRAYDVYRASEQKSSGTEPWQSKLRVPYAQQVIDTALVNIVTGGKPRCKVDARHPADELNAKKMQMALDYYIGEDHLVEKQPGFTQQGLIYGVTIAKNHWLYKEANRVGRQFTVDPLTGQQVEAHVQQRIVERDGPTFEPWNVYDAWWDPNARDVDSAKYFILRSWSRLEDLRAAGIYDNLDLLAKTGPGRAPQRSAQERALGGSANRRKDMVELLEVWYVVDGEVRMAVVGNRQVLLRNEPSPYWHGKFPIVVAQTRPDLFELAGISETELVDHLQTALWTVQNMRMDNLHLSVMRGITYREGGVIDPNALVLKPRFKWGVTDHDDIKPFEVPPLPPEAYREEEGLLGRMQLVTGITPYISGADQQGADQNTATGISVLSEVASRLLRFKAAQLQYKGYQRSFEMWGDMIQQFLDHTQAVKIVDEDGNEGWHEFGPQDVVGHFHYALSGTEESLSKSQQRQEAIALLNSFAPFAQLGIVNWREVMGRVCEAYDLNPAQILNPPQQPQVPPSPGGFPGQQTAQQPQMPSTQGNQMFLPAGVSNSILQGR